MATPVGLKVLDKLVEYESKIGVLYAIYAEKDTANSAFWSRMVAAENGHATLVERVREEICSGRAEFRLAQDVNTRSLERALEALEREIEAARCAKGGLRSVIALAHAFAVESSLLEDRFYEVAVGDSARLRSFKKGMNASILTHRRMLRAALEKALKEDLRSLSPRGAS